MENVVELEVRWGECDPFQIVFYPNFFTWFDHCTWKLFEAAGFGPKVLAERFNFLGMPLVEAQSKFLQPARPADVLAIRSRVSSWSRSSFKVSHRVMRGNDTLAEGLETRVWTGPHPDDPTRPKAMAIPRAVIDAMDG